MKLIKKPAYAYYEVIMCDCGGEMKFTGNAFPCNPQKYEWQCLKCKHKEATTTLPGIQFSKTPIDFDKEL